MTESIRIFINIFSVMKKSHEGVMIMRSGEIAITGKER